MLSPLDAVHHAVRTIGGFSRGAIFIVDELLANWPARPASPRWPRALGNKSAFLQPIQNTSDTTWLIDVKASQPSRTWIRDDILESTGDILLNKRTNRSVNQQQASLDPSPIRQE
jgi:hypothetical protein